MRNILYLLLCFSVLICVCPSLLAKTNNEEIIRELYNHATQVPMPTIKVRAIVRLTGNAWTEEQIESEVSSQMGRISGERSEIFLKNHAQTIRNAVRAANFGVRWMLFEETKVPEFYRLDIKEYYNIEPIVDNTVIYSNNIFEAYHINNYGRTEPKYKESHALKGQIVIDNSLTPVVWAQENLYVARYLEGEASKMLVFLLLKKPAPPVLQQLFQAYKKEDDGVMPSVPLDEEKLYGLINGKLANVKMTIEPNGTPQSWFIRLSAQGDHGKASVEYTIDETLPYLILKVRIINGGGEYISERKGLTDFGFPSLWRVEQHAVNGTLTAREIHILSVTTNIDLSTALATNYPTGCKVWERVGNGEMRQVSKAENQSLAIRPTREHPAQFDKHGQQAVVKKKAPLGLVTWCAIALASMTVFAIVKWLRKRKSP